MSGLVTRLHLQDGALIAESVQDCTPIARAAHEAHVTGAHGSSDMRRAASIPNVLIEAYCNRNGITFEEWCCNKEHVRRLVNDPALKAFRIWPGRV